MIKFGTSVVVLENAGYNDAFVGSVGTVLGYYAGSHRIGVKLDDAVNRCSKNGLFWLDEDRVEVIPQTVATVFNTNTTIKKVIFSGPKTIVIWCDGTKTIVGCAKDDFYDPYTGFCAAVAKKVFGSTSQVKKICDTYLEEEDHD